MNVLSRYAMSRGRGNTMQTLDDIGGNHMGGGALGGEPILMGYQPGQMQGDGLSGGAPQMPQSDGNIDQQLMHSLMTKAETREQAESMLRQFAQESGDAGLEAIGRVAKQLNLRAPWHRDFSDPPWKMPGAQMGPTGKPRPLQRDDGY